MHEDVQLDVVGIVKRVDDFADCTLWLKLDRTIISSWVSNGFSLSFSESGQKSLPWSGSVSSVLMSSPFSKGWLYRESAWNLHCR